jgi:hypothetical protein
MTREVEHRKEDPESFTWTASVISILSKVTKENHDFGKED